MKKESIAIALAGILGLSLFAACNNEGGKSPKEAFDKNREIFVITREAGSGTRDAFVELTGVLVKQDGKKKDNTTKEAITIDGTQGVMSTVAGNEYAIGYISLGSLNNTVKALQIDGVSPDKSSVKKGAYPIARPFNIATRGTPSALAQDFIQFILSASGQAVVDANGYVGVSEGKTYEAKDASGKLVIAGSSSVSPVMEKLKEAYIRLNPAVEIEIQTNDSSSGMLAAMEGTCDIGMASRNLKTSETEKLTPITIARDGIAVIVNNKNPKAEMRLTSLREVYTGFSKVWNDAE